MAGNRLTDLKEERRRVIACQWCGGTDAYVAGYSPMCVETQYRCRECGGDTYHDDAPSDSYVAQ